MNSLLTLRKIRKNFIFRVKFFRYLLYLVQKSVYYSQGEYTPVHTT